MAIFLKDKTQRDILALFTANIFYKFTGYLVIVILAKSLGKENLGKFFFALSFTGLFIIFSELGINTLLTRALSRDKNNIHVYMSNVLGIRLMLSLLCFVIINFIAFFTKRQLFIIILLASIFILIESIYSSLGALFLAYKKVKYNIVSGVSAKILLIFLLIFLILTQRPTLINILWIHIISSGFMLFLALGITRNKITTINLSYDFKLYKQIIKSSLPFALLTIMGIIFYRVDSVMLGFMKSYKEVGIYGAGYKLREASYFIPGVAAMILYPHMAELYKRPSELKRLYIKSIRWLIVPGFIIPMIIIPFGTQIISVIYGSQFINTVRVLKVLYVTLPVVFINMMSITLFKATDKEYLLLFITAACLIFKILLNFLLIPAYSYIGAAISTVFIDIAQFSILIFYINIFIVKSTNL
jgi:O-antigen/teichoic acid export membrane protein